MIAGVSTVTVGLEAPFLDGHFPGNPLVPGVAILEQVVAAIARAQGRPAGVDGFPSVKFISPLRPGEPLVIEVRSARDDSLVTFSCRVGERRIAEGSVRLRNARAGTERSD